MTRTRDKSLTFLTSRREHVQNRWPALPHRRLTLCSRVALVFTRGQYPSLTRVGLIGRRAEW